MTRRLTISSGLGPIEVRAFVASLADAIEALASERGVEVAHRVVHGANDAPHSVDLVLLGATERLVDLVGTHALVARSATRSKRDRKRWFVSVRIDDVPSVQPIAIDLRDVEIDACRASGAGGQHVQKTASAVRVRHRPSGIAIRIENERSQHRNRSIALERLAEALAERGRNAAAGDAAGRRHACLHVERGRPVCVWRSNGSGLVVDGGSDAP